MDVHHNDQGVIRVVGIVAHQDRFKVKAPTADAQTQVVVKLVMGIFRPSFQLFVDLAAVVNVQIQFLQTNVCGLYDLSQYTNTYLTFC